MGSQILVKYERWVVSTGTIHLREQSDTTYLCGALLKVGHRKTSLKIDICGRCVEMRKTAERRRKKNDSEIRNPVRKRYGR